jgi:hypothetical protein
MPERVNQEGADVSVRRPVELEAPVFELVDRIEVLMPVRPPFEELERVNEEDDVPEGPIEPVTEISKLRDRVEALRTIVPLADRDEPATLYLNPDRFPTEFSRERVMETMARIYPGVDFAVRRVRLSDLEHWSFTRFASVEEVFRRRGYLSNLEIRGFAQGERKPQTVHLARNRSAAFLQLTVIADFYDVYRPSAKTWRPPPAPAGRAGRAGRAAREVFKGLEAWLVDLMGKNGRAPLVRRHDVYLPCDPADIEGDVVYLALNAKALRSAIKVGRTDPFRLVSALPGEIAEQVRFEYDNAALFDGATREALLLWQTQALAYLRMAAWNVEFYGGKTLHDVVVNSRKLLDDEESLRALTERVLWSNLAFDHSEEIRWPESEALGSIEDKIIATFGEHARVGGTRCDRGLDDAELFIAALHGSTFGPLSTPKPMSERDLRHHYLEDPLAVLLPVASWLGDLKRQRRVMLDRRMARLLLEIPMDADRIGIDRFVPLVRDRLGEPAWEVLVDACNELLDVEGMAPVEVVYEWTRDAAEPWRGERIDIGKMRIRGPLLDFPLGEAAVWNERAAALWSPERGAFVQGAGPHARPVG